MYKKIMVPLDGSDLAECVIPHVEAIAGGCQVPDVVFIRVVQPAKVPSLGDFIVSGDELNQMDTANKDSAEEYLNRLLGRLKLDQANLQAEIIVGKGVAESLADYMTKNEADLIVIATHGRSGVSRWVLGSVADRILRSSCIPVLMVQAPGCASGI
ncbi:universal stress protein [Chloroflexota bacterium]